MKFVMGRYSVLPRVTNACLNLKLYVKRHGIFHLSNKYTKRLVGTILM